MRNAMLGIAALVCILSCGSRRGASSNIIATEKMEAVMWDIIEADVFTEQFVKRDTTKNAKAENVQLQNKIFALHKITRDDFNKSYDYYITHSDLMRVMLDSMSVKAERERMKMLQRQHGGSKRPKDE